MDDGQYLVGWSVVIAPGCAGLSSDTALDGDLQ